MSAEDSDFGRHENGIPDDLALSRTRTRVSRACTRCRSRKDKCDGARPSCAACRASNQPCSYEPSTKKRGLPEGYVRGLEKLWAVLIAKIDGIEDAVAQILEDHKDTILQVWNHRQTGEELHSMWKDSRVLQELETLLAALENAPAYGTKRKRDRDEDDTTPPDDSPDLDHILSPAFSIQMGAGMRQEPVSRSTSKQWSRPNVQSEGVMLPPVASEIIGQYFKFTHCWLPMLDKPRVLRCCYEYSRSHTSIGHTNVDLAVVFAALAYASRSTATAVRSFDWKAHLGGLSLSQLSRKCIPSVEGEFELGHVQALLILALHDIGDSMWESAWRSVGLAARAMEGTPDTSPTPSKHYAATRQMCLILDTAIALRLDRNPQLSSQEIARLGLLDEDGHEEWEPWAGSSEPSFTISCFNRLTQIFTILNNFLRRGASQPHLAAPGIADESLKALESLQAGYPSPVNDPASCPPHQLWLKAAHLLASAYIAAPQAQQMLPAMNCLDSVGNVLQTWTTSSSVGLAVMPTFILGLLHAACERLVANRHPRASVVNPFGLGLIADRLSEASKSWSEAGKVSKRLHEHFGNTTSTFDTSSNGPAKRRRAPALPADPAETQHGSLNLWPSDPFTRTFANMPESMGPTSAARNTRSSMPGPAQQFTGFHIPFEASGSRHNSVNTGIVYPSGSPTVTGNMSLDAATSELNQSHMSIATSPSFQGDEIDALFREMAQLDTTEWTNDRSQGLKDFGFHDDMTFEAFCNDPDRLYSSPNNINNQQFNTMTDNTMLTFDPNLISQPQTALHTFDMVGSSWHG